MPLLELFHDAKARVAAVIDEPFDITDGRVIPHIDSLPYGNKATVIETAVLFVDLRSSTELVDQLRTTTVAKIHKCFLNEMVRAASLWGGQVRGFAGDRIMVLCDPGDSACDQAANIAVTMQNITEYIIDRAINKRYNARVRCGIGIDYGKMLVARVGMQRDTSKNDLVWTGGPANVASKLADRAPVRQIRITPNVYRRLDKSKKRYGWWKTTTQTIGVKEMTVWWANKLLFNDIEQV